MITYTGPREKQALMGVLDEDNFAYTCGTTFEELLLPEELDAHTVVVKAHSCFDVVEALYYSNPNNDLICVYCACLLPDMDWSVNTASVYPKCTDCAERPDVGIKKRKKRVPVADS